MIKLLKNNGGKFKRQGKGSHEIWIKDNASVSIPRHPSKEVPTGTYKSIKKKIEER